MGVDHRGYVAASANLYLLIRVLLVVVLTLAGIHLYDSYSIKALANRQKVVLQPVGLKDSAWISSDAASDTYLRQMVRLISGLALSYRPEMAGTQFKELVAMYAPEQRTDAKIKWEKEAESVQRQNVTSAFQLEKIELPRDGVLEVTGMRKLSVDDSKLKDEQRTYLIEFQITDYRFEIISLLEKEK